MRALSMCCVAVFATIGCQSPASQHQPVEPVYDQSSGKLRELTYDADQDGRPEMKALMDGSEVRTVEVDENGDGQTDRWEYYEQSGQSADARLAPTLVKVERAMRLDGRVTRTEGFVNGNLAWAEEDRDANGRIDRWEKYAGGTLSSLALDTRGSGTPNRLLTYNGDDVQIDEK